MMMQFRYVLTKQAPEEAGCLCYLQKEQSLCYTPWRKNSYTLLIGKAYCGLDLDAATGEIMQISGCNPMGLWVPCNLDVPPASRGRVFFQPDAPLVPGTGGDYDRSWDTFYDRNRQTICLGQRFAGSDCVQIQFAPHLIASIRDGRLEAIWAKLQIMEKAPG